MALIVNWLSAGMAIVRSRLVSAPVAAAALVVCAAIICATPESTAASRAASERNLSTVRITLGEEGRRWELIPTLLDGQVESFLALREDVPFGENLTAVWYRKTSTGAGVDEWTALAWTEQNQSRVVRAVKDALSLPDSTDDLWPVGLAAASAVAPEPLAKGLLESDPLAPIVAELEDPRPLVEMLEIAGWKAAWIDPLESFIVLAGDPTGAACHQSVRLEGLATLIEYGSAHAVPSHSLAETDCAELVAAAACFRVGAASAWSAWNCGAWEYTGPTMLADCRTQCNWKREVWRTRFRVVTEYRCDSGAIIGTITQAQRESGIQPFQDEMLGRIGSAPLQPACPIIQCPTQPPITTVNDPGCVPPNSRTVGPWEDPAPMP